MKKGTLIAVVVFAGLLAVALLTREDKVSEGVPKFGWQAPDKDKVSKVEIHGPKGALLAKGSAGWTVADPLKADVTFATDEALVTSLLGALSEVKATDYVTSRPERLAELELDDAKGLKVTVSGEGAPASLVFGKAAKAGGVYVKLPGSGDVFSTNARLASLARRDVNGWRKRSLLAVKVEELVSLKVKLEDSELSLSQKDGVWSVEPAPPKGFRFDPAAAQRLAQQLAGLSAQDFGADATVATQSAQLVAQTKDGRAVDVTLGAEANGLVPVRVAGDAQVYLVSAFTAKALTKKLEDLRDVSLLAFEPEKVERLTIVAGAKMTVAAKVGGAWKLVEPKALPSGFDFDTGQVTAVLGRLRGLRALRFDGSPAALAGCRKPAVVSVDLEFEGGAKRQLRLDGELGANELCATGSADALTYAVSKSERTWLEGGVELFKRAPAPRFPQGGIQGLDQLPPEIRAKLQEQLRQQHLQPQP